MNLKLLVMSSHGDQVGFKKSYAHGVFRDCPLVVSNPNYLHVGIRLLSLLCVCHGSGGRLMRIVQVLPEVVDYEMDGRLPWTMHHFCITLGINNLTSA